MKNGVSQELAPISPAVPLVSSMRPYVGVETAFTKPYAEVQSVEDVAAAVQEVVSNQRFPVSLAPRVSRSTPAAGIESYQGRVEFPVWDPDSIKMDTGWSNLAVDVQRPGWLRRVCAKMIGSPAMAHVYVSGFAGGYRAGGMGVSQEGSTQPTLPTPERDLVSV